MAFGNAIQQRLSELARAGAHIPDVIAKNQKLAIEKAVEVATELTAPNENTPPRGAGTITGEAKAAWANDSHTFPLVTGNEYTVVLANNKDYISHINYGFNMDQHFVPGLIINPYTGLLEKVDPSLGGIVVGTKTTHVNGKYMRETALSNYRGTLERNLIAELRELHNNGG